MSHSGQPVAQRQPAPLRCCLLSGGASRRMGRDKALLSHPEGGTWLERSLMLLGQLQLPISVLSRHGSHLELAWQLAATTALPITPIPEPPPWEGPLLALHRLMQHHPDAALLLCPVDMPWLNLDALQALRAAAAAEPGCIHLAHDGGRLQPLLGVYPGQRELSAHLAIAVAGGERRLQHWLASHPWRSVALEARSLRNVNCPQDWSGGAEPVSNGVH
ncbi:NTP transferase domain-containing protein [Cyanobium sp. ATX 6A2]|uniref:NTP transferase domain-containing protein n=1 Tax=Cyanobium sp. ATX 6A2 TaxID=2823700 RepID=UPI0020CECA7F|nr:NTP transferase domain-containing protein [Cyanobium sp. ATX 6A2]MCP9887681.1 NTP transferase domain-containing protein [Cyanobium sp. ATX 6A2]